MLTVMSHHLPLAAAADSDGALGSLGSPYASYSSSFPLLHDDGDDECVASSAPLSLSMPPFSSPGPMQPAAPLPRRLSSTLFRLSPTFQHESYYYQWSDMPQPQPQPQSQLAHHQSATSAAAQLAVGANHTVMPRPLSPTQLHDEKSSESASSSEASITPPIPVTSTALSIAPISSHVLPVSLPIPSSAPTVRPNTITTAVALPSPTPPLLLRPAASASSDHDRVIRKRRRQRECDIQRRRKENIGYNRLYALLTADSVKKQQRQLQQQQQDDGDKDYDDIEQKMQKADILHHSAERIEQLERMLRQLTEAHARRNALSSAMYTHSSACIVIIHVPSGYVSDASERYLEHSMFERLWVVGRRFFPPWPAIHSNPLHLTRPNTPTPYQADRMLCKPANGPLQETRLVPQSEKSVRLLRELFAGEIDTIYTLWRSQFGDGRIWERSVHSWVSEWEEHEDGRRTPLYVVGLVSMSETVCLE